MLRPLQVHLSVLCVIIELYLRPHICLFISRHRDVGVKMESEEEMENLRELMSQIKNVYKKYSKIPDSELDEILKHDYWWNADICMSKGLVDEVRESDRSYVFRREQLDI